MNLPARCNFVFDIVVTRYDLPKFKVYDATKLTIEAKFNFDTIKITSSRHNVTEFNPKASTEFTQTAKKLRQNLEEGGMPIVVKYKDSVIGSGQVNFPGTFIDQIQDGMTDLLHSDSCKIDLNVGTKGTIEILCRLIIKCFDTKKEEEPECGQNINKSINPRDIMFIMGENQRCTKPCEVCPDVMPPSDDDDEGNNDRLRLDLERYKSMNNQWHAQKDIIDQPTRKSICCELKQMTQECGQIVDAVTAQTKARSCTSPVSYDPVDDFMIKPSVHSCFAFLPTQRQGDTEPRSISMPISDIGKPIIKPTRFCPVCLTNMSWLPKFAACPKCGIKPMPMLEERHKDKLTAEQILLDYLGKPLDLLIDDPCQTPCKEEAQKKENKESKAECRCTCQFGKMCAHCRIRRLCGDIFQSDKTTNCNVEPPKSSEDYCAIIENKEQCRPYLSRVFSELKDLYDIKEMKLQAPQDKICEKAKSIRSSKSSSRGSSKSLIEPKKIQVKIGPGKAKTKPVVVVKALERKKSRLGHKHCVNQQTAVSKNHGWDWKSSTESRKHGWRPGYILKPIKRLMNFFLHYKPQESAEKICQRIKEEELEKRKSQQPTLNVCKKNGEIYITLRAVNDPNVEMNPITFKIVKSAQAVALREIKQKLKQRGFRKCICHKPLMLCVCRNHMEKRQLGCALRHECHRRGMENCVNQLVLTDTSDSEMEYDIDVSPPAAAAKARQLPKRGHCNNSTQTPKKKEKADTVTPKYPVPHPGPYWRTYDCAAADRYRCTAFGNPGEVVFEDGVFGYRGGGAHGATPGGKPRSKTIWGESNGHPICGGRDGRGAGHGGPGGAAAFAKSHVPGAKGHAAGKSKLIPVRMPKRLQKSAREAERARREAAEKAEKLRKNGIDMIKYLNSHKKKRVIGPDGLTDAQRRRLALRQVPAPSIENVTHRGHGFDPCEVQCSDWCNPFGYEY
ncbi:uncharacterized protein LOC117574125 [Drosophila albomicans]|uniref:Uncharacterized protein LOC117574125 n=1 Tax=Drosophila albomicans TaxID=7291 RepID=A0A6P8XBR3_DROAB|nr:uncharacterized protein LOC117574125 [Drosophila albomicans]